jgi:hypothetical protein
MVAATAFGFLEHPDFVVCPAGNVVKSAYSKFPFLIHLNLHSIYMVRSMRFALLHGIIIKIFYEGKCLPHIWCTMLPNDTKKFGYQIPCVARFNLFSIYFTPVKSRTHWLSA